MRPPPPDGRLRPRAHTFSAQNFPPDDRRAEAAAAATRGARHPRGARAQPLRLEFRAQPRAAAVHRREQLRQSAGYPEERFDRLRADTRLAESAKVRRFRVTVPQSPVDVQVSGCDFITRAVRVFRIDFAMIAKNSRSIYSITRVLGIINIF